MPKILIIVLIVFLTDSNSSQAAPACSKSDTNKVFYYSFNLGKVIEINKTTFEIENMHVYEGCKVILEAPHYLENTFYVWEGPAGFRSCSAKIIIEQASIDNSGLYKLKIYKRNTTETGNINLVINKKNSSLKVFNQGNIFDFLYKSPTLLKANKLNFNLATLVK